MENADIYALTHAHTHTHITAHEYTYNTWMRDVRNVGSSFIQLLS